MRKLFLIIIFIGEIVYAQPADINFEEEITIETVNVPSEVAIIFSKINY